MSELLSRLSTALEGRYSIEREIGAGGMATVYLARDVKHSRSVALKVLKPELAAVLGGERFLTEITTTAKLQHPHILPLFDSGEADSFLYYVMPYIEGESLRDRLNREHQLPVKEAVAMAEAVAGALDYAHRHDVIHRDIKPENILLHDGNPVVADFGIALAVSEAAGGRMTETGLSLGSPHYMSPEQATADRDLSGRSDVYSLACVLYEMLAGNPPHTGPTPQSILMRILTEDPRPVTEARKSVPPHVAAALAKALEKLPADRFESAAEFARALGDEGFTYGTTGPIAAVEPGVSSLGDRADRSEPGGSGRTSRWFSDARSWVAIVAVSAVIFLVSLDLFVPPEDGASRLAAVVTRFEVDLGDLQVPSQMALSPDGTRLVFASQAPGGSPQLYMRLSDDIVVRPIPGTEDASYPVFSPDGEWIAFVVNGVDLKRIPTRGGAALSITSLPPIIVSPAWGPDGSILFAAQQGLYRVPFGGGEPARILGSPRLTSLWPKHLPGGKAVLFSYRPLPSLPPELRLLDLESGEAKTLGPGREARYLETGHLIYLTADNAMVASPFDLDRGEISGAATPVVDVMASGPGPTGINFALGASGAAVYSVGSTDQLEETLVMVALDGRESPILGLPTGNFSAPRFDPTGRYLAFEIDGTLWIRDLVLGSQELLSEEASFNPVWSVDGSKLAFGSAPATVMQILIRASNLDSPAELLVESRNVVVPSAWTPDGSHVLYSEFATLAVSGSDILIADTGAPGTIEPFLRADGWSDGWASLSPDGRWAVYESNEEGANSVYVRAFPDPGEKIKVSEGEGIGARWSADGRRIFYRNRDTTKVANVRTEPTFEVVSHETLFSGPYSGIDPHPDGTHIVAIRRGGATEVDPLNRQLYWVVNWLDGVKARLGVGR